MPSNHKRPNQGRNTPASATADAVPAEIASEKPAKDAPNPEPPKTAVAQQDAPQAATAAPAAAATAAPAAAGPAAPPPRRQGLNITDLKDMGIQKLTQIAKDLNVSGATGMRKQDLIFQIL